MAYLAGTGLGDRTTVRGAGGTGFVAANPEYDIPRYLAQIHDGALDVRNPELVVIAGGSNDVGQPVDQVKKNARKILRIARKKYPHALLVLVGPMDPYGGYADSIPIRDALRAVAKGLDVPFIDDMTWLAGHPEWLCDDYVHPTYAAHGPWGSDTRRRSGSAGPDRPECVLELRCGTPGPSARRRAASPRPRGLRCRRERHDAGELGQADDPCRGGAVRARRSADRAGADRVRPRVGADHVAVLRRLLHRRGCLHRPNDSMGAIAARRLGWKYHIRGGGGSGFVAGNPDYEFRTSSGRSGWRARRRACRLAGDRGRRQRQERRPGTRHPARRQDPQRRGQEAPGGPPVLVGTMDSTSTASPTPTA